MRKEWVEKSVNSFQHSCEWANCWRLLSTKFATNLPFNSTKIETVCWNELRSFSSGFRSDIVSGSLHFCSFVLYSDEEEEKKARNLFSSMAKKRLSAWWTVQYFILVVFFSFFYSFYFAHRMKWRKSERYFLTFKQSLEFNTLHDIYICNETHEYCHIFHKFDTRILISSQPIHSFLWFQF